MAAAGLADEVRALLDHGVSPGCTAMQAIGYKELSAAVAGGGDLNAPLEQVKLRSRQYAKRQLTWFRRDRSIQWFQYGPEPDVAAPSTVCNRKNDRIWNTMTRGQARVARP